MFVCLYSGKHSCISSEWPGTYVVVYKLKLFPKTLTYTQHDISVINESCDITNYIEYTSKYGSNKNFVNVGNSLFSVSVVKITLLSVQNGQERGCLTN